LGIEISADRHHFISVFFFSNVDDLYATATHERRSREEKEGDLSANKNEAWLLRQELVETPCRNCPSYRALIAPGGQVGQVPFPRPNPPAQ
jgi:hypothetical protein